MAIYDEAKALMEKILPAQEITAIAAYVEDPVQWWSDALKNKAASRMKATIAEHTNLNPGKLDAATMRQEIGKLTLESAKARNAREMAELDAIISRQNQDLIIALEESGILIKDKLYQGMINSMVEKQKLRVELFKMKD